MHEKLFSYGTLRYDDVQRATFGRLLHGSPDRLTGYRIVMLPIRDASVVALSGEALHPMLVPSAAPADGVDGMVFEITPDELRHADRYEVSDYRRVAVMLASGVTAWAYVSAHGEESAA